MKKILHILAAVALVSCISGCTSAEGRVASAVITDGCDLGVVLLGEPGAAPICASPDIIEKIFEDYAKAQGSTTGARVPMTKAALYQAALAAGAKPIATNGGAK